MGIKISALPSIATPALTDVFPVVQSGVTYKETFTQLSSLFATAGANSNITSLSGLTTPLSVPQGGTGITSATAYAVLVGGTTSVNPFQSVASVGTAGQVLTSNGAGAKPSFQAVSAAGAFSSIVIQVFTATGTYTPTSGMKYCIVELVGGGGGGGGTTTCAANEISSGGGGGGGGYAIKMFSAATIGASQAVTIGAGGTAGAVGGGTGGTGGTTSLGALLSATGGSGGVGDGVHTGTGGELGGAGGTGSSGSFNTSGSRGFPSMGFGTLNYSVGGSGGSSILSGTATPTSTATSAGATGVSYGGGASGAQTINSGTQAAGGVGGPGIVVVTEFI